MTKILGIDLGTTNSVAAIAHDDRVEVLEIDGSKLLPSVVGLDNNGKLLVGTAARNQWILAPDRTIRSIKRKMGAKDKTRLGDHEYSPQEVSAIILRTIKEKSEKLLGESIERAVITVPAFFGEQQREATREAGIMAGFDVARIINEPTAASLAYQPRPEKFERLLIYDLGGGTFDVSVVQIEDGIVEVLASHGDTQLGGDDFDRLLLDHVCDQFQEEHEVDLRAAVTARSRTLHACEMAKIRLSDEAYVTIEEEFIAEKAGIPRHLNMEVARTDYEPLIESLLNKTLVCVDEALADAKLTAKKLDRVILVGGASRTPMVYRMLAEQLGRPIHLDVDPDLCVAIGAATQGAMIAGQDVGPVLVDITPRTLGIRCLGQLHGLRTDCRFSPLIHRNTPLPASKSNIFFTAHDGQKSAAVEVYQGEEDDVTLNDPVGDFLLEGLAEVSSGNEIVVHFDLDLDGILTVTATEHATGLEERVVMDNVISRFQDEDRAEAQSRIEQVFATARTPAADAGDSAVAPVAPETVPATFSMDEVPESLRPAVQGSMELIERALALMDAASTQDQADIERLVAQLREGIEQHSEKKISQATAELDDLVFYLQDV